MKVILSSKHLATHLSKIDFPLDGVTKVSIAPRERIIIETPQQKITVLQHAIDTVKEESILQAGIRWDSLYEVVKNMPDKAIQLTIEPHFLEVIF